MTPRRPRGKGTIEPTPSGRFRPRLPGNGGRLRVCDTYEEAAAILDAALEQISAGEALAPGAATLAGFGLEVLDVRELSGVRGVRTERSRWATHVVGSRLGELPPAQVRRSDVIAWRDEMLAKLAAPGNKYKRAPTRRISRGTVKNALNLVRAILAAALDREILESNPARDVKLARGRGVTHEPWTYLLPEEQTALLTCTTIAEDRRLLMMFALGTGMREAEVWNLPLCDVDQKRGRIVVRYGRKGATKSGKPKVVQLFGMARLALDAWLPRLAKQQNPSGLVWPHADGERRRGYAPSWWHDALVAACIVDELAPQTEAAPRLLSGVRRHDGRVPRWHDLRHTCGSSLVAGWWGRRWSLQEVCAQLGHSGIGVTQRYAHLAELVLHEAAAEADRALLLSPHGGVMPASFVPDLSHLRDLNSRPAVYEDPITLSLSAEVQRLRGEILGLGQRAARALAAVAAGGPAAWRVTEEALVAVIVAGEDAAAGQHGAGKGRRTA